MFPNRKREQPQDLTLTPRSEITEHHPKYSTVRLNTLRSPIHINNLRQKRTDFVVHAQRSCGAEAELLAIERDRIEHHDAVTHGLIHCENCTWSSMLASPLAIRLRSRPRLMTHESLTLVNSYLKRDEWRAGGVWTVR